MWQRSQNAPVCAIALASCSICGVRVYLEQHQEHLRPAHAAIAGWREGGINFAFEYDGPRRRSPADL